MQKNKYLVYVRDSEMFSFPTKQARNKFCKLLRELRLEYIFTV